MTEERRAILELRKILKWLADDNTWQDIWEEIDTIKDEWETEEQFKKELENDAI